MAPNVKSPWWRVADHPWVRHGIAGVLALAVNGALMLYLAGRCRNGAADKQVPPTVPVQVVDMQMEEPRRTQSQQQPRPNKTPEQPPEMPLSQPTMMEIPDLSQAHDQPALPEMQRPEMDYENWAQMPTYVVAEATSTQPVPGPPADKGSDKAGRASATRGPALVRPPDLSAYYPYRARVRGLTGKTRARLTIDRSGRVTKVEILSSSPAGVFEQAARRVCRSLRFQPALRDGAPTRARATMTLNWRLDK